MSMLEVKILMLMMLKNTFRTQSFINIHFIIQKSKQNFKAYHFLMVKEFMGMCIKVNRMKE